MKVIRKQPGKKPELIDIPNTLEALQNEVGGFIETYTLACGACVVCNEEGRLLGLPYCATVADVEFVGTILVVGVDGEDFCGMSKPDIAARLLFRESLEA